MVNTRISECNGVRQDAVVKKPLLRTLCRNSELSMFLALAMGKKFPQCIIDLPQK